MKHLIFTLPFWCIGALSYAQTQEDHIQQIRTWYQQTEEGLKDAHQFVEQRIWDSEPEIWMLIRHDGYHLDIPSTSYVTVPYDGRRIVYYWNGEIHKILDAEGDYPEGFSSTTTEYYFHDNEVFFIFRRFYQNEYYGENPGTTVTESRYYYKDGKLIRHLEKTYDNRGGNLETAGQTTPNRTLTPEGLGPLPGAQKLLDHFADRGFLMLRDPR